MTNQITHTHNSRELLLFGIPKDTSRTGMLSTEVFGYKKLGRTQIVRLSKGNYKLLGTSTTMSEEEASELIESVMNDGVRRFKIYVKINGVSWCQFAKTSLNSLLHSLGLDPDNYQIVVLEKIK